VSSLAYKNTLITEAVRPETHSSKESYRLCKKDYETEEEAMAQQMVAGPLMNE
jgi:hypothetical protein